MTRIPPQTQDRQPGIETEMTPRPKAKGREYKAADKLLGKVALITGGDSGIGRAVAIHFAKEGADVGIVYLDEHEDAERTKADVEALGRKCVAISGDVGDDAFCRRAVDEVVSEFGRLDVLVNNAAEQHYREEPEDVDPKGLERTFRTNVFGTFFMTNAALDHLGEGAAIINTTSVVAYKGSAKLLDYASTKGALVAYTRSLASALLDRGIRVNAVAPGPVWTPLIPASFPAEDVEDFGDHYPMERAAEPEEIAPTFVFLASDDASFYTGQVLHPNGGKVVNA